MAKTTPGEFVRQVRAEANKIVWPTPRETMVTSIMVLIMTTILAVFFLGIDGIFRFNNRGIAQRALEVSEIGAGGFRVVDPAPTKW